MYTLSCAEQWVVESFKSRGILHPEDLHFDRLAAVFGLHVEYHYKKSRCFYNDNFAVVYIDNRLPMHLQRADFFHELSHILIHSGDQRKMPTALKKMQEGQARWFSLYVSLPYHMIYNRVGQYIADIAEKFMLPNEMVEERLRQIYNRMILYSH